MRQKPRIAYIVSQFPRYDETFIMREMIEVSKNGPDVSVFSLKPCRDKIIHQDSAKLIAQTHYVPYAISSIFWKGVLYFLLRHPLLCLAIYFTILRYFWYKPVVLLKNIVVFKKSMGFAYLAKKENIAHIHGHWATYPTMAAWVIWRLTGIKYSFTGHAHDIYLDTTMLDRKMHDAQFVLTCTADNKKYLKKIAPEVPSDKITVAYHGLDLSRFFPLPKQNEKLEIISVGSLLECKGFEYLIKACRILKDGDRSFSCTIAGGGPLEGRLRSMIDQLGLSQDVRLTGYVNQEQVIALYQKADVLVLPAVLKIHWGIPNVLVEALACETPVAITPLPSIVEVIEGDDVGFIIPERNPDAIAEVIDRLIAEPELATKMGEIGRVKVMRMFDLKTNGKTIADIFMKAVSENEAKN